MQTVHLCKFKLVVNFEDNMIPKETVTMERI